MSQPSDDVTVYLVLNDHSEFGIAYDETDPADCQSNDLPYSPLMLAALIIGHHFSISAF
jgi:hypothetical protein